MNNLGLTNGVQYIGWVISFTITTADTYFGDDFYNWIDKKNKK